MLESQLSPIGEVQNDSKFEDSIVTDALLQMTSFSSNSAHVDGKNYMVHHIKGIHMLLPFTL